MKPTSNSSFYDMLDTWLDGLDADMCSSATRSSIELVWSDVNPEQYDLADYESFIDEVVLTTYEWISTEEGLNDFLGTRYSEEDDEEIQASSLFYIGNSDNDKYLDFESFIKDVDFKFVINVLRDGWDKACA